MNRNLLTLIAVFFCFLNVKAENDKTELVIIYSEYCSYSQKLINNTLCNRMVEQIITENFEYKLLEQNTEEAQDYIKKLKITGFPTQIIIKKTNTLLAYGVLSVTEQLDFLKTKNELNSIVDYFYDNNIFETQQGASAFEEYVFLETTLGFDEDSRKLLIPGINEPYRMCGKREKPDKYVCGGGGAPSHNFITKGKGSGDFKVAIFHPSQKTRDSSVSVTSFVEDGKVTQQSRCFYDATGVGLGTGNKRHYQISRMECYVATPELCEVLNNIEDIEEFKSKEVFDSFLGVLKSNSYKQSVINAYKYNWEKAFLNVNRNEHYDYYSKLDSKRYYSEEKQGREEATSIVNFENSLAVKKSKNLFEVFQKANSLIEIVFYKPCQNLTQNNILAKTKSE